VLALLAQAERPVIVAGGGVRASGAHAVASAVARTLVRDAVDQAALDSASPRCVA